jgi:hypothetical protein
MTTTPTIDTTVMTTRPTTASSREAFHSIDELSFRPHTSVTEDSRNSINSINSSFWNYPLRYQSHNNKNETVY